MFEHQERTYRVLPCKSGEGTFFYTDCGHKMYSVDNEMTYHGKLCPACFQKNIYTTLYLRGTEESNKLFEDKEYLNKYGAIKVMEG